MTDPAPARGIRSGILAPAYLSTTVAIFALIAFNAFETMAVTTVMPTISRELDGASLYALAFAAPLASGVVGMVAAGTWSDRHGPAGSLVTSLLLFTAGVLAAGLAPSMGVLVAGRVVQGLGTGALIVSLYVVVGAVFPPRLQPSVFATFAAAWVLPSLFGPPVAAFVAAAFGWRWVFLGIVGLVALAALMLAPVVPSLRRTPDHDRATPRSRLGWASLAAVAVLAVELLGSRDAAVLAAAAGLVVVLAVRPLVPGGTLRVARGLPSVIGTRGAMSAAFFCGQAYIVLVLQERWGLSAAQAGLALTVVGVVWATMSQVQARVVDQVSHERAMLIGSSTLLAAALSLWLVVRLDGSALLAGAAFVLAGAGMGFGFTRTGPAMLGHSTESDRGFNSSALSIADSLGAALALACCGIGFAWAESTGRDPFLAVFGIAVVAALAAVVAASRTPTGQAVTERVTR
ncbi:MFS transporter [Nocardioides coralli]|uniref:MFS transporter n=1 Tax=Nocardioides coralli TaxID=2872154 RepID=UPI00201706A2|nr:MFS transporter [Nocardioides coralli]